MDGLLALFTRILIFMCLQNNIAGTNALPCCHSGRNRSPICDRRGGVQSIISEDTFQKLFLHRDDAACPANGFYAYTAFLNATLAFPDFGNAGGFQTRKREIAAFLAQTSHETSGGWATAPDGPYAWGLCYKEEVNQQNDYCDQTDKDWPCVPGVKYYGRGPIQLSWNFNYGPAGKALGFDGLKHPEVVSSDATMSFKVALWFWMTRRPPKPSCHDVITRCYRPTPADRKGGRLAGFGLLTNIINGGLECGRGQDDRVDDRIGYYRHYCEILRVNTGPNLDCANQTAY